MNQDFLRRVWLFVALVPSLVISYQPLLVMATSGESDAVIIIAQVDNSPQDSPSGLETVREQAKSLKESIDRLNQDLIRVYNKEIDRQQVDFNTPRTKLQQLQTTWEQRKNELNASSLEPNSVNSFVTKVDEQLASMERVLGPLNNNIIQSQEQLRKKKSISSIPALISYQKELFGENASSDETDGIFGKGTQRQIELILTKNIGEIRNNIDEIQFLVLSKERQRLNNSSPRSNNSQEALEQLQRELAQKNQQIENLTNQVRQLQAQNPTQEPVTTVPNQGTNTESSSGKNFLVPLVFLVIIGAIGVLAFRKFNFWKKAQRDLLNNPSKTRRENTNLEELEPENYYNKTDYSSNISEEIERTQWQQMGRTTSSNPVKTVLNKESPSRQLKEETSKINLDDIKTEDDLISLYNNNYKALLEQIVIVTATKKSVEDKRAGYDSLITFEELDSGSYWITDVPQFKTPHYFLVPKKNLIINEHNYESVKYVFDCRRYDERSSNKFVLRKAAIVYWDDSAGKFCLYELGEVVFY
ncbi:hypothetical protein [Gloeothece verrucosa]|uniref:Uncharacterized protein n=1 Tax=Gloeothece verrucosa (strain PCC 7822) TaxID=497965 RepID=E0UNX0_GLOV7|nr:hypothetical protein [Gloeothece verrucosa]ADN18650.1 hypothetical protein Cyan7822_6705 [Gloeothece verrucosa PCC 7822]